MLAINNCKYHGEEGYNFSAISGRKQVSFQWDDDEVRFVPDQHAYLDVHSASALEKKNSPRMNMSPHIGIYKDLYLNTQSIHVTSRLSTQH
jgi:hypothetical protein